MTEAQINRLRGLLDSAKLKQTEAKHLTIHRDELPSVIDALAATLTDKR